MIPKQTLKDLKDMSKTLEENSGIGPNLVVMGEEPALAILGIDSKDFEDGRFEDENGNVIIKETFNGRSVFTFKFKGDPK